MDSYGDWLRGRTDEELAALVRARPELITPVPADLGALAARAATPPAVSRALDGLDRAALAVLESVIVLPSPTITALKKALGPRVAESVDNLLALGLVWPGTRRSYQVAPGIRAALREPAGLGPPARDAFAVLPLDRLVVLAEDLGLSTAFANASGLAEAVAARLADPADLVADAGPEARTALERLAWGPPSGRIENARRPVTLATAASPIDRLLARGLLVATDDRTVTLPREVGLYLRGGVLFRENVLTEPSAAGPERPQGLTDQIASGQVFTALRLMEELLEGWGLEPPSVLRSGGLAVRDLRAAAARLDVAEQDVALLAEVAYAAGLLARDVGWTPTRSYDLWLLRGAAERWADLANAWLDTDRVPGLAGGKDDRDKTINALADESVRAHAPRVRREVLEALPDEVAASEESLMERLTWRRPRRTGGLYSRMASWTLREAAFLGLTGFGAKASYTGPFLRGEDVTGGLGALLPAPVDHVLLQADLTAVAPGPLVPELARELALAADVESTGGATVYRFTPASVRRAMDAGRTISELLDLLTRHSATPVPQPLAYLVEDVGRKHGRLRVGTALSYVRCDDPAVLDEILADRRASALRLYRLAPTVLASRLSRQDLLESLRSVGFSPVPESAEGGLVVTRTDAHRAETPARPPIDHEQVVDADIAAAAVRALRAGEEAAAVGAPDGDPPRTPSMATIERLRSAIGSRVWIGYLDQQGQATSRIVEPVRVDGGYLTAYDRTKASVQRFTLHRITGVRDV
ncbi:helicase C-terminal domain-containing protein [Actinocorallia sp. API 0066]|uniref:helicase-associated domain-containing protein n=1 Tax=Actinocorallia sp. API 0066 TaxID=2896846 RepID=UPI001E5FC339|nr:helicase-associated domain-containing protein [Actinocorallia sp. API 0066]MCD0447677.1 helicase C-terminal domain-containing protein [Actinocorallia sp. API 0066]